MHNIFHEEIDFALKRFSAAGKNELATPLHFSWERRNEEQVPTGRKFHIFEGCTADLARLNVHISELNQDMTPHTFHAHEDTELIYIQRGAVDIKDVSDEKSDIRLQRSMAGDCVYHPHRIPHTITTRSAPSSIFLCLRITSKPAYTSLASEGANKLPADPEQTVTILSSSASSSTSASFSSSSSSSSSSCKSSAGPAGLESTKKMSYGFSGGIVTTSIGGGNITAAVTTASTASTASATTSSSAATAAAAFNAHDSLVTVVDGEYLVTLDNEEKEEEEKEKDGEGHGNKDKTTSSSSYHLHPLDVLVLPRRCGSWSIQPLNRSSGSSSSSGREGSSSAWVTQLVVHE